MENKLDKIKEIFFGESLDYLSSVQAPAMVSFLFWIED
jgi:hypothetical protein